MFGQSKAKSQSSRNKTVKRQMIKRLMVISMGHACQTCGYDRCDRALDFHHLDMGEKEFNFSDYLRNVKSGLDVWPIFVGELKKCIMLCKCCHMEVHDGVMNLPLATKTSFDDKYENVESWEHMRQLVGIGGTEEIKLVSKVVQQKVSKGVVKRRPPRSPRDSFR